jgi:CRISPR-associated protein Cas2
MLLVCYDISSDRLRTKFSKFLKKYGRKIQYSIVEIKNSPRLLTIILTEIDKVFKPRFAMSDSVLIVPVSLKDRTKIVRYGYSVQEEGDLLWVK